MDKQRYFKEGDYETGFAILNAIKSIKNNEISLKDLEISVINSIDSDATKEFYECVLVDKNYTYGSITKKYTKFGINFIVQPKEL